MAINFRDALIERELGELDNGFDSLFYASAANLSALDDKRAVNPRCQVETADKTFDQY